MSIERTNFTEQEKLAQRLGGAESDRILSLNSERDLKKIAENEARAKFNDEVEKYNEDLKKYFLTVNLESSGVHVISFFIQLWNKNLNYNPKYEYCRNYVQVKWYSLFDDLMKIYNENNYIL